MGSGFGSGQKPVAQYRWMGERVYHRHTPPPRDCDACKDARSRLQQQQLPANRSFGPGELPGHGWRQPREQLYCTSSKQTFHGGSARPLMALGPEHTLLFPALLQGTHSPPVFVSPHLNKKCICYCFFHIHIQRQRDRYFVPVSITYSHDPKLNPLWRTKYLYLACTAIMILQPLTPCSHCHGGQLAYKSNEII